jgi:hypothetical protein
MRLGPALPSDRPGAIATEDEKFNKKAQDYQQTQVKKTFIKLNMFYIIQYIMVMVPSAKWVEKILRTHFSLHQNSHVEQSTVD